LRLGIAARQGVVDLPRGGPPIVDFATDNDQLQFAICVLLDAPEESIITDRGSHCTEQYGGDQSMHHNGSGRQAIVMNASRCSRCASRDNTHRD